MASAPGSAGPIRPVCPHLLTCVHTVKASPPAAPGPGPPPTHTPPWDPHPHPAGILVVVAGVVWTHCLPGHIKDRVLDLAAPLLGLAARGFEAVLDLIITAWDWARAKLSGGSSRRHLRLLPPGRAPEAVFWVQRAARRLVPDAVWLPADAAPPASVDLRARISPHPPTHSAAHPAPCVPGLQAPASAARQRRHTLSPWQKWTRKTTAARRSSRGGDPLPGAVRGRRAQRASARLPARALLHAGRRVMVRGPPACAALRCMAVGCLSRQSWCLRHAGPGLCCHRACILFDAAPPTCSAFLLTLLFPSRALSVAFQTNYKPQEVRFLQWVAGADRGAATEEQQAGSMHRFVRSCECRKNTIAAGGWTGLHRSRAFGQGLQGHGERVAWGILGPGQTGHPPGMCAGRKEVENQ